MSFFFKRSVWISLLLDKQQLVWISRFPLETVFERYFDFPYARNSPFDVEEYNLHANCSHSSPTWPASFIVTRLFYYTILLFVTFLIRSTLHFTKIIRSTVHTQRYIMYYYTRKKKPNNNNVKLEYSMYCKYYWYSVEITIFRISM